MALRYKLVTQDYKTRKWFKNETEWKIGKRVEATGDPKQGLCSDGYLHCSDSPELAVMLNEIHAQIEDPRMLAVHCHGRGENDVGLKRGYRAMTPVREIPVPQVTREQKTRFAILCAMEVYHEPGWVAWARDWLSGKDRTAARAETVGICARLAASAARASNPYYFDRAACAADAAADAAFAACDAVHTPFDQDAATGITISCAAFAAEAVYHAAHVKRLDLVKLARKALEG